MGVVFLPSTAYNSMLEFLIWFVELDHPSSVARSNTVLKVEVAHPVDDVKQQEGGGEKDA